jgi:hypothetical protein
MTFDRKRHAKGAALTGVTADIDIAAIGFGNRFDDSESQAGPR